MSSWAGTAVSADGLATEEPSPEMGRARKLAAPGDAEGFSLAGVGMSVVWGDVAFPSAA